MIVFVCDHVGVIADNSHRLHLFQANLWGEYDEAFVDDAPIEPFCSIMSGLQFQGNELVVVTGISEIFYGGLEDWYMKHQITPEAIYMRPWSDIPKTKEPEFKLAVFNEQIKPKYADDTAFVVLDDRDDVVAAFRNAGIECWQVRNGAVGT